MSVAVRFLGSGDAFGSGGRFQACLLLSGGGEPLLVDCGATSLVALKQARIDPGSVGAVVLSHLHGDHFGGIPFLILDGQFSRRERPLLIAGPEGVRERVEAAMEVFFPGSTAIGRRFAVEFLEFEDRCPVEVGSARVTPFVADHAAGAPSFALRVEYGGKVAAYSGDTAWTEGLVDASRGADLFVCEAYFFAKQVRYHLDHQTLVAHRHELASKRIILTHMSAETLDQPEAAFERAYDGLVVEL